MLTIQAEASAGKDLKVAMVEMLDLARRLGVRVELKGNETTFWVTPDDTREGVEDAFDRLYPASRLVASWISEPVRRRVG